MCIFCMISNHEIPSQIVYENDKVIAFLDLSQATRGHTLVVPKKHFKNIYELDEEYGRAVMDAVRLVSNKLKKALNPIGLNLINNNERPLQSVDHFHIHLLPRYENDDFVVNFKDHSKQVNLEEILADINK